MTTNDGGPAFPVEVYGPQAVEHDVQTGPSTFKAQGMTLRDYFAAQAMVAVCDRLSDARQRVRHRRDGRLRNRRRDAGRTREGAGMTHAVHPNSVAAYDPAEMSKRATQVLAAFKLARAPMTDRECAKVMGFPHKSAVQPRISELVASGYLSEISSARDEITGKTVRVCWPTEKGRRT